MKVFLAQEPSTGDVYVLRAADEKAALRKFGEQILGMAGDFKTSDVNIGLVELEIDDNVHRVMMD